MKLLSFLKPQHYWNVLVALIVMLFLAALMEERPVLYILFAISLFSIFGSIITTIWRKPLPRMIAWICIILAILSSNIWLIPGVTEGHQIVGFIVAAGAYAGFILIAIIAMLKDIFHQDTVTTDTIVGSICVYLLFGMFFAFVFAVCDLINPQSFNFGMTASPSLQEFREYLYFSYTTLTTLGYGDMTPQLAIPRLLTSLQAMVGPIYLAILVARLVGLHISQSVAGKNKG